MEDQAKQALAQLLERAISGVDKAVEFSQAQIPDVVEQLLMWKFSISLLQVSGPILMFLVSLTIFVKYGMKCIKGKSRDNDGLYPFEPNQYYKRDGDPTSYTVVVKWVPGALSFILGVQSLLGLFLNTDWLQILIAPKLYLLEYAAKLVN